MPMQRLLACLVASALIGPLLAVAEPETPPRESVAKDPHAPVRTRTANEERPEPKGPPPESNIVVVPVRHANAREAARVLRELLPLMEKHTVITVDEPTNAIILGADPQVALPKLQSVLAALDQPPSETAEATNFQLQAVALKHALANEVADRLPALIGGVSGKARIRGLGGEDRTSTRFIADPRANVVWISGESADVKAAAAYAAEMDKVTGLVGATVPRVEGLSLHAFPLRHADAEHTAEHVQSLLPKIMVVGDDDSGTLLAVVSTDQASMIASIVEKIDVPRRSPVAEEPTRESDE